MVELNCAMDTEIDCMHKSTIFSLPQNVLQG